MYAVIEACGKQYKVQEGDVLFMEKLGAEAGETVKFDKVIMASVDEELKTGKPYLEGAFVEAEVIKNAKARKIIVYKYNPKKTLQEKAGPQAALYKSPDNKISV